MLLTDGKNQNHEKENISSKGTDQTVEGKFAPISQKSRSKAHKGLSTARERANKRKVPMSMMSGPKELEVVAEVEPKIQLNVETQAEPPQPTPREEGVGSFPASSCS